MEEYPDYKRQKKLEETNDATKVWALSPNRTQGKMRRTFFEVVRGTFSRCE